MTISHENWESLLAGLGATHIQHADGVPVSYATRVRLASDTATPKDPAELEVVLYNEIGNEIGRIPGDALVELRGGAASILVVSDEIEPAGGPTVVTRGVSSPDQSTAEEPS